MISEDGLMVGNPSLQSPMEHQMSPSTRKLEISCLVMVLKLPIKTIHSDIQNSLPEKNIGIQECPVVRKYHETL